MAQCPVDHSALGSSSSASSSSYPSASSSATTAGGSTSGDRCPVDHGSFVHSATSESGGAGADKCPVEHGARSTWGGLLGSSSSSLASSSASASASASASSSSSTSLLGHLPTAREISSIPRADGEKWVYPSEAQFFAAMERKQHNPRAQDMRVVVPIHNAVNERAWGEVLNWERGWGGDKCGGVKLVSFKGRPKDRTPKAWLKTLLGYQAPFDRHDWVVDRCGTRMRYVLDFYTGKSPIAGNLAFYIDARPALDNWEGVKMRTTRFLERWVGPVPWFSGSREVPAKTSP